MSKQPIKAKPALKAPAPKVAPKAVAPKAVATPKIAPMAKTQPVPIEPKVKRIVRPKGGEEATTEAPITGDANTNELATVSATAVLSLRDLTVQRYQSRGWQIMNTPRGGINDLVAGKSVGGKYKYHFVQFVESEDDIDNAPRYKGEAKGAFIQNAYSNQATPVYVIPRRSGANRKVVLENADTTQKIIP
jgi:hypothetical protein